MARIGLVAMLAVGYGLAGTGLGLDAHLGVGMVGMTFLNSQLEALAARQGGTFSPLRTAWEGRGDIWLLPLAGVGITWLHASGTTLGREEQRQEVAALGAEAKVATPRSLFGWPVGAGLGVGGYLVTASGLVTGSGLAWGAHAGVEWRFLAWGGIEAVATVRWRYLPAWSLYDGRGEVNTRGQVAADFSGLYIGVSVGWR